MSPRIAASLLVSFALLIVGVSPAEAEPKRWPSARVSYDDQTTKKKLVEEAVRRWNAVAAVRLVPKAGKKGDPKIAILPRGDQQCTNGTPCSDLPPKGRVFMGPDWKSDWKTLRNDPQQSEEQVDQLTHEIGRALGLDYRKTGCTIMDKNVQQGLDRCGEGNPEKGRFRCGPSRQDALALARLYDVKVTKGAGVCIEPELVVEQDDPKGAVVLLQEDVEDDPTVPIDLVNNGEEPWGRSGLEVVFRSVDAAGNPVDPCKEGDELEPDLDVVEPGDVVELILTVCIPKGSRGLLDAPTTYWYRYESEGIGQRYGAPQPLQVRYNLAPVLAAVTATQPVASGAGYAVTFGAVVSSDDALDYEWDFGDIDSDTDESTAAAPTHVYTEGDTYEADLTVTDTEGQSVDLSVTVVIPGEPTEEP